MASTLIVSGLTDYVNVHKDELIVKAALGGKTLERIEIMPNVKYKDALNYLDSTVVLADGSVCGFNAQGSDVFSDRTIEVKPVKVEKEFCAKDMRKKYMNHQLMFEAGRENLPFEEKIAEANVNAVKDAVEDLIWNGNSGLTIDGFVAQLSGETSTIDVTLTSGMTILDEVDAVVAAATEQMLKKGVHIFLAPADYRAYVRAYNANCCANKPILDAAADEIVYFGDSRVKLYNTVGLEGKNTIVGATPDALVYGTDVEGSEAEFKMWYSQDDDMFRMRILFNAGTAIKFPDETILATR